MKGLTLISAGLTLFVLPTLLSAQTFSGRLTSSFYTFERSDTTGASSTHARGYQSFQFDLRNKNFLFRTFGQMDTDFSTRLAGDGKVRMYNFYLQWRDNKKRVEIDVGRQPVFSGVAVGTIDGAQVKIKPARWLRLKGFGGGLMPSDQRLKLVDGLGDNYMAGGQALFFPIADVKVGVSYFNKRQTRASYRTLRADSVGNVFTQFIEPESQAYQFASLDAAWTIKNETSLYARSDYDLDGEQITRAEFSARTNLSPKFSINAGYTFRSPRLPSNSIFSIFNVENNHEIEGGIYYRRTPRFGIFATVAGIFYETPATVRTASDPEQKDRSLRATVGCDFAYGGLNYVRRSGYAGNLDGLNGSLYYPLNNGQFMPSVQLSWASFKLDSNAEERETLFTGAAGLLVRPHQLVTIDGQVQLLHNRFYSSDARFLLRVQYMFFTRI
jgi:hypothetical protein